MCVDSCVGVQVQQCTWEVRGRLVRGGSFLPPRGSRVSNSSLSGLTEGAFTQTHKLLCSPYHSESVSFHNLQQITRPVWEEQIYIGSNKRNAYSSSPIGWVGDSNKYYHERLYHDESCGIPQNQRAPSCTRVGPDSSFLLKVQELGN